MLVQISNKYSIFYEDIFAQGKQFHVISLVITKCTLFASTSMSSVEAGTVIGDKNRLSIVIFVRVWLNTCPARTTVISKHFSLFLDSAFNLEPNNTIVVVLLVRLLNA